MGVLVGMGMMLAKGDIAIYRRSLTREFGLEDWARGSASFVVTQQIRGHGLTTLRLDVNGHVEIATRIRTGPVRRRARLLLVRRRLLVVEEDRRGYRGDICAGKDAVAIDRSPSRQR